MLVKFNEMGEVPFHLARMVFMQRQKIKNLLLWSRVVGGTSNLKTSRPSFRNEHDVREGTGLKVALLIIKFCVY